MPKTPTPDAEAVSRRGHRRTIGTFGLALPFLVWLVAGLLPTPGLPRWHPLTSVSAYYYTGGVGVFVGLLIALSLFLFTYPGYKDNRADRFIAKVGCFAAIGLALFPTGAPVESLARPWWREWSGVVHSVSAVTLFTTFILFAIWLFRKSSTPKRRDRPLEKRLRDDICLVCGLCMIASVLWAAIGKQVGRTIFWPESIAIVAFAASWLVKSWGRDSDGV